MEDQKMKGKYLLTLVLTIALALGYSLGYAQIPPPMELVGEWEGLAGERSGKRNLLIESMTPKDGGWVAEGRFRGARSGASGKKRVTVATKVLLQDGTHVLEFEDARQAPVQLKLVGEKEIEGWERYGRTLNKKRRFKLYKVE